MIKYIPALTDIVLEEIPDRVTLAVEISNCQGNCRGCHSPFLRKDIGEELNHAAVDKIISDNFGANCFLFLGEGSDLAALKEIAGYVRSRYPHMELALYSGRKEVEPELAELFDFLKTGPYIPEYGPLNEPTTNQRLYYKGEDITPVFWRKKKQDN